jgi:hypothetical protein
MDPVRDSGSVEPIAFLDLILGRELFLEQKETGKGARKYVVKLRISIRVNMVMVLVVYGASILTLGKTIIWPMRSYHP